MRLLSDTLNCLLRIAGRARFRRLCHIGHMKTIIRVTDRGREVAVLKASTPAEVAGKKFPKRRLALLPKVRIDSTAYISEERDAK